MGIYSTTTPENRMEGQLSESALAELGEAYIYDELSMLSDDQKQAFVESDEAKAMVEGGILNKKTLVRLTKKDDLSRRSTMAAFQLAKEADDPLWQQLVKNRIKERELIAKIESKYASKAEKSAKIGQKEYLSKKMPLAFMRPNGVH